MLAVNYDPGETVGWPRLVAQVQQAVDSLPPGQRDGAVVLTGNYGEAGAIERFAPGLRVFSGHNGYADWGPPPDDAAPVVVVGSQDLGSVLSGCEQVGVVDNGIGSGQRRERCAHPAVPAGLPRPGGTSGRAYAASAEVFPSPPRTGV